MGEGTAGTVSPAGPWRGSAPVDRSLLRAPAEQVAPRLLGSLLLVDGPEGAVCVRVDEVEAYAGPGQDPGSHAHRGRTRRNATMFGPPGGLYVYFTYGMHWCANVVTHPGTDGSAGAVLLRAGEVVHGAEVARPRRAAARRDLDLARGPARLTQALAVTGDDDGTDLLDGTGRVHLLEGPGPVEVAAGPRVGVAGEGAATPWRWWDARSGAVSAYRAAQPRPRPATARSTAPSDGGAGDVPGGAT